MADNNMVDVFDPADIEKNKVISGICYLGILFFLPLVACPDSQYGRFHANQALVNMLLGIASSVVMIIPFIGWIVGAVAGIACFVFMIMGIINGCTGKAKRLPIIGNITILK